MHIDPLSFEKAELGAKDMLAVRDRPQTLEPLDFEPSAKIPHTVSIDSLYVQNGRISRDEIVRRSKAVLTMGLPSAARLANTYKGKLIIAGGGPSLAETLPDIRRQLRTSKTTKIAAVNRTHDWLIKKGFKPDFGILIDPKPWVANYMTPTKGVRYLHGAKVDQKTWDRFKNHPEVYHWHPLELAEEKSLISHGQEWCAVPGQSTVGLRAVPLGYVLGFRKFELHGLDCNKRGDAGHAYQKFTKEEQLEFSPESDLGYRIFYVNSPTHGIRCYEGTTHMARQLGEFCKMYEETLELHRRGKWEPITIQVAGDSALGYLAACNGLHTNDDYNKNPKLMPMTGCLDPNLLEDAA